MMHFRRLCPPVSIGRAARALLLVAAACSDSEDDPVAAAGAAGENGGAAGATAAGGGGAAGTGMGGSTLETASGCPAGTAFFCEDFEALEVGQAQPTDDWIPDPRGPSVTIDSDVVRGTRSLHLRAMGGQNARIFPRTFAPENNSFFGRMYAFVEEFPSAPNYAHFVMVEAQGPDGERPRPIGGQFIQGQGSLWGVGSDGGPSGDWTSWQPTTPTEAGRWQCLEWHMSSVNNSIEVWIDGMAKPELSVSTSEHGGEGDFVFPEVNSLWIGWWLFQSGSTPAQFNVWLDDIALSNERIGC